MVEADTFLKISLSVTFHYINDNDNMALWQRAISQNGTWQDIEEIVTPFNTSLISSTVPASEDQLEHNYSG